MERTDGVVGSAHPTNCQDPKNQAYAGVHSVSPNLQLIIQAKLVFMEKKPLANQIVDELNSSGSDRAVAIVGASLIEDLLKRLLIKFAVKSRDFEQFIERSSSANLLIVSYAFGLIPGDLKHDINFILKIRNKLAHEWKQRSFDDFEVGKLVDSLKAPQNFGNIKGEPVKIDSGSTRSLLELPRRIQFISTVVAASTTLEHITSERAKLSASTRFYLRQD